MSTITKTVKRITSHEFGDYFPLDYAAALAAGLNPHDITQSSAVTRRLRDWANDRKSQVTRGQVFIGCRVCRDVLRDLAANT